MKYVPTRCDLVAKHFEKMVIFNNLPKLSECVAEVTRFLPQLPNKVQMMACVARQILADDQDHLGLFEVMMGELEADLHKSFRDLLLERFKKSQSPNVVNIYARFCNMCKDSEDFESLVTNLYAHAQTQNVE